MSDLSTNVLESITLMYAWDVLSRERTGGYLCVLDAETGQELLLCPMGSLTAREKAAQYRGHAKEKAQRLFALSRGDQNQWSSWQSRDESIERYGGAVRSARYIFSFSGFPELADEALMLVLAMKFDDMPSEVANLIAGISGNTYFMTLKLALGRVLAE